MRKPENTLPRSHLAILKFADQVTAFDLVQGGKFSGALAVSEMRLRGLDFGGVGEHRPRGDVKGAEDSIRNPGIQKGIWLHGKDLKNRPSVMSLTSYRAPHATRRISLQAAGIEQLAYLCGGEGGMVTLFGDIVEMHSRFPSTRSALGKCIRYFLSFAAARVASAQ